MAFADSLWQLLLSGLGSALFGSWLLQFDFRWVCLGGAAAFLAAAAATAGRLRHPDGVLSRHPHRRARAGSPGGQPDPSRLGLAPGWWRRQLAVRLCSTPASSRPALAAAGRRGRAHLHCAGAPIWRSLAESGQTSGLTTTKARRKAGFSSISWAVCLAADRQ